MGRLLFSLLVLLTYFPLTAQVDADKTLFSDAISKNIRKYRIASKNAYLDKDEERAQFLFDSLVDHVITGSYLDNFEVRKYSGRRIKLHGFEKPIFLITYASWCVPGIGEIPALNELSALYHNQIDFVVLFWGSKKKVRKVKKQFGRYVNVLFVDEKDNRSDFAIRSMKHSLGFPTTFVVDGSRKILDVSHNYQHHYSTGFSQSFNDHYQSFMRGINQLKQE